jgi:hypothetical protein
MVFEWVGNPDPGIPILKEAKADCAKLQQPSGLSM